MARLTKQGEESIQFCLYIVKDLNVILSHFFFYIYPLMTSS